VCVCTNIYISQFGPDLVSGPPEGDYFISNVCVLFLTWRLYFVIRPTFAFMTLNWSPGPQHYSAGRWRRSWEASPAVTNTQDTYAH